MLYYNSVIWLFPVTDEEIRILFPDKMLVMSFLVYSTLLPMDIQTGLITIYLLLAGFQCKHSWIIESSPSGNPAEIPQRRV